MKISVHRICLIVSLFFSTIGCDQITKTVARDSLQITGPLSYLNDLVRLEFAQNPGAFLSLGADLSATLRFWIFNVSVVVGLGVLAIYLLSTKQSRPLIVVALTLVLGGGVGNLIDRFARGSVTDFLIVGVGQFKTGIFNFADMAIVSGIILLAVASWTKSRDRDF